MKQLLVLFFFAACAHVAAQDFTGDWGGRLSVSGVELRLVFHISRSGDSYTSLMDSPDQGVKGIPVTSTLVDGNNLSIEIANAGISYSGVLEGAAINGTFRQAGQSYELSLTQAGAQQTGLKRPQEPVMPYPYYTEEVSFKNPKAGNIMLAGTLTLPAKKGKYPVVVLISGSGPQNRNEALLGHQSFLVLADYLTRRGIGVLRYDDRGTYGSQGDFASATTMDFATDAEAAVAYLKTRKEVDKKHIGLAGHSEGGVVAPIVASRNKDVAYIVLLAGTGIRGAELLLLQQELIGRAGGASEEELALAKRINRGAFDIVLANEDPAVLDAKMRAYLEQEFAQLPDSLRERGLVEQTMQQLDAPWMTAFIRLDPATALRKVSCPVLALNGEKDLQVPPAENLSAIRAALEAGGNRNVTVTELSGLNHLFQQCTTGSPDEYAKIEETFSPKALEAVANWILAQTDK